MVWYRYILNDIKPYFELMFLLNIMNKNLRIRPGIQTRNAPFIMQPRRPLRLRLRRRLFYHKKIHFCSFRPQSRDLKLRFVLSVLLYGCETWKSTTASLKTFVIRCLKHMRLTDRFSNCGDALVSRDSSSRFSGGEKATKSRRMPFWNPQSKTERHVVERERPSPRCRSKRPLSTISGSFWRGLVDALCALFVIRVTTILNEDNFSPAKSFAMDKKWF